jgi:hypothetical protein
MVTTAASLPSTYGLDCIVDSLNPHSHGVIISPNRIVLQLDCPGFPVYNYSWKTNATALVRLMRPRRGFADKSITRRFTISPSALSTPKSSSIMTQPILPLGPSRSRRAQHPTNAALPIPSRLSIEDYPDAPNVHSTTDLLGWAEAKPMPNSYGWDMTGIQFATLVYCTA